MTGAAAATGCVKSSTHDRTLAELAASQAQTDRTRQELAESTARLQDELAGVRAQRERTQRALEDSQARVRQLEGQIRDLERDNLAIENERNRLQTQLNQRGLETNALLTRVEQLSALEKEFRERNSIYEDVIRRFRSLIEGGQLSVSISRGRLSINLPQDILFASGVATIGREGRTTLTEVAKVLGEIPDRQFQVEGHTDDKPIQTAQFPSNWELSAARAISVVHLLEEQGVKPENISGAAFGQYQPVASNGDDAGRRLNRRIEIVMVPNLEVIAGGLPPGEDR